jgi:hypothetical protein
MRWNSINEKEEKRVWIIQYLTDYGYGQSTAEYEVDTWIKYGLDFLSPTPRADIQIALIQYGYREEQINEKA